MKKYIFIYICKMMHLFDGEIFKVVAPKSYSTCHCIRYNMKQFNFLHFCNYFYSSGPKIILHAVGSSQVHTNKMSYLIWNLKKLHKCIFLVWLMCSNTLCVCVSVCVCVWGGGGGMFMWFMRTQICIMAWVWHRYYKEKVIYEDIFSVPII